MKEQAPSRENPFFVHYGSIVVGWFADGAVREKSTKDLMAWATPVLPWHEAGVAHELQEERPGFFQDKARMAILQQKVEKIRTALLDESDPVHGKTTPRPRPMTQQLELFQLALMTRNEGLMAENPFYELTHLLFEINLVALREAFVAHQKHSCAPPPPPIKVTRSLATIWGGGAGVLSLWQKILETLTKTGHLGKFLLGLFLYCGSSLTTAMGANDLVQDPSFIKLFGEGLTGPEHQNLRMVSCLLAGLLLSSVILDFKSRLFQGIAVTGRVGGGIVAAFRRYPRWFVIAFFLTGVSISTNFDGIVLLASKSNDLQQQWLVIRERVSAALGNPQAVNPDKPSTLYDVKAGLESKVKTALEKFHAVPQDEMQGIASSGLAKKGPRYWGKHYIINGGYQPGRHDVALESEKKSALAAEIDAMLRTARLDLNVSLDGRIQQIMAEYQKDFSNMEAVVGHEMRSLENMLNFESLTLENSGHVLALEPYHVNEKVESIVHALEKNKGRFVVTARKIEDLSSQYIQLLRAVDRAGTPSNVNYDIQIKIDIPEISAIDKLKEGGIPLAKRRTLSELYAFLLGHYGVVLGMVLLVTILFIAVSMDLSDPILYSVMVARWGRRDQQFLAENIQRFVEWEADHVTRIRSYLVRSEVRSLMPSVPCPKKEIIHLMLHELLEDANPVVKDASTRSWVERLRYWFMELFTTTRVSTVEAYNARQTLVSDYYRRHESYAPNLLGRIFPGLFKPLQGSFYTFDACYATVFDNILKTKEKFDADLESGYAKVRQALEQDGTSGVAGSPRGVSLWSRFKGVSYTLFLRPLDVADANPFPLTRVGWFQALTRDQAASHDRKNVLEQLVPFLLTSLNTRFPEIRKSYLAPLTQSLTRITKPDGLVNAFRIDHLRQELDYLERGYFELLGLAHFHRSLFHENVFIEVVQANKLTEVDNVLKNPERKFDSQPMEQQITHLEERFSQILRLIDNLVAQQDTLIYTLTRIRKDHLSPIDSIMEHLKFREVFEMTLGIDRLVCSLKTIEDFLLDLWDSRKSSADSAAESGFPESRGITAAKKALSQDQYHEIISIISFEKETGEFILLQQVQNLEKKFQETHARLNTTIFVLTLVDKIASKIKTQMQEGLAILSEIHDIEPLFLLGSEFPGDPVQQGKRVFLENYRLFLRSVPLQINTIKDRLDLLLQNPHIAESHNVALCRTLESQCFKLFSFLKNCLEYLQDKRDSVGLSTSLVQLNPGQLGSHGVVDQAPEAVSELDPKEDALPADARPSAIVELVRQDLEATRKLLLGINQLEWKALACPIPPQELIKSFKANQPFLKHLSLSLEETQATLQRVQASIEETAPEDETLAILLPVFQQTRIDLKRIRHIHGLVSASPIVDRRLQPENDKSNPLQGEILKRSEDLLYQSCGTSYHNSRRQTERALVSSTIELTLATGEVITGRTIDISKTGLAMESDAADPAWAKGMQGTFTLGLDPRKSRFTCHMVRASGKRAAMAIAAEDAERFVQLVRERVLGGTAGGLIALDPEFTITL
ncbi:MAG: PilZ domain-containing protein [Magnetococcales bacterium]|nr:PilZ domain-containing protein [Magnetococcales bacterium]